MTDKRDAGPARKPPILEKLWKPLNPEWINAPPDTDLVKGGIAQIESALRIYRKEGDARLGSVLWRVCDGLGDLLKHMVETGEHDSKRHMTGKGYSIEMSAQRFAEAMESRKKVAGDDKPL